MLFSLTPTRWVLSPSAWFLSDLGMLCYSEPWVWHDFFFFPRSPMGPSALCGPQLFSSWVHGLPSSNAVHAFPSALGTHLACPFSSTLIQRSSNKDGGSYFLCASLIQDNPSVVSNSSCIRCLWTKTQKDLWDVIEREKCLPTMFLCIVAMFFC